MDGCAWCRVCVGGVCGGAWDVRVCVCDVWWYFLFRVEGVEGYSSFSGCGMGVFFLQVREWVCGREGLSRPSTNKKVRIHERCYQLLSNTKDPRKSQILDRSDLHSRKAVFSHNSENSHLIHERCSTRSSPKRNCWRRVVEFMGGVPQCQRFFHEEKNRAVVRVFKFGSAPNSRSVQQRAIALPAAPKLLHTQRQMSKQIIFEHDFTSSITISPLLCALCTARHTTRYCTKRVHHHHASKTILFSSPNEHEHHRAYLTSACARSCGWSRCIVVRTLPLSFQVFFSKTCIFSNLLSKREKCRLALCKAIQ